MAPDRLPGLCRVARQDRVEDRLVLLEERQFTECPEMEIDPEALSRALINLLNNALKYSPDEKSIRVSARREGVIA